MPEAPPAGWTRTDTRALAGLLTLGALASIVPALVGHPLLAGDNLIQNYPLRTLVGTLLAHGQLPLWDPYLWSGTFLLAGSNAGALYPATALFAVLPPLLAWVLGQALVNAVALTGAYLLFRRSPLPVAAATLGALCFGFGGFMAAQLLHLGAVEATSWLPWLLLGLRSLARAAAAGRTRAAWRWAALTAGVAALTVLAGSPRSTTTAVVAAAVWSAELCWRHRRHVGAIAGPALAAAGTALLVSAVYWLPALAAVASSQRAQTDYAFYASFDVPPALLALFVTPFAAGGLGKLGIPLYVGAGNLTEVSGYLGVLPLFGAVSLLAGRVRRACPARVLPYFLLLATGVLLAVAPATPLGHLLHHIPLYGGQRNAGRNLAMADLGLAGLGACWLAAFLARPVRRRPGDPAGRARSDTAVPVPASGARRPRATRLRGADGLSLALLAAGVLAGALAAACAWAPAGTVSALALSPAIVAAAPVGLGWASGTLLAAGAVVVVAGRLNRRTRTGVIAAFLLADLALFAIQVVSVQTALTPRVPQAAGLFARLAAPPGRSAVYDPQLVDNSAMLRLGAVDSNILAGRDSIQGYGSVVSAAYNTATASHTQDSLAVSALGDGVADELDLRVLAAPPSAFLAPTPTAGSSLGLPAGTTVTVFLGTPLRVSGVGLPGFAGSHGRVAVSLLSPTGRVRALGEVAIGARLAVTPPERAVALRLRDVTGLAEGLLDVTVDSPGLPPLVVTGGLGTALGEAGWRYAGVDDGFAVFRNPHARGPFWLAGDPVGQSRPASLTVLPGPTWAAPRVRVDTARPTTLVWSESYAPGWTATLRRLGPARPGAAGPATRSVAVTRRGLLDAIAVPAGTWLVRLSYTPAPVRLGGRLSLVGLVGLAVLATAPPLRRRRLRQPANPPPDPAASQAEPAGTPLAAGPRADEAGRTSRPRSAP